MLVRWIFRLHDVDAYDYQICGDNRHRVSRLVVGSALPRGYHRHAACINVFRSFAQPQDIRLALTTHRIRCLLHFLPNRCSFVLDFLRVHDHSASGNVRSVRAFFCNCARDCIAQRRRCIDGAYQQLWCVRRICRIVSGWLSARVDRISRRALRFVDLRASGGFDSDVLCPSHTVRGSCTKLKKRGNKVSRLSSPQ